MESPASHPAPETKLIGPICEPASSCILSVLQTHLRHSPQVVFSGGVHAHEAPRASSRAEGCEVSGCASTNLSAV